MTGFGPVSLAHGEEEVLKGALGLLEGGLGESEGGGIGAWVEEGEGE